VPIRACLRIGLLSYASGGSAKNNCCFIQPGSTDSLRLPSIVVCSGLTTMITPFRACWCEDWCEIFMPYRTLPYRLFYIVVIVHQFLTINMSIFSFLVGGGGVGDCYFLGGVMGLDGGGGRGSA
jgi:hypothetical protein